ncbi:DNA ligase 1 [Anabrus simplex]|uniref:DNA ligase 1 n=1 Tax=Anabrus simplex TaxID=316456 RepID=UPI0035A386DA
MALVQSNFPVTNVTPGTTIMEPPVRMTPTTTNGGSRLAQMQARFQQKQLQEKEQKLLRLYESQQQRAFQRVAARGSAGSSSVSSVSSNNSSMSVGKVRQMFDERRTNGSTGWDRSYPLEPLDNSLSKSRGAPPAAKTKANRVASLDRSQNSNQITKTNVKRSKSHARESVTNELNGSYRRQQQQNNVETDYNASFRRLTVEDEDGNIRKVSNTERFNESFRVQPEEERFNGSYRKQHLDNNFEGSYSREDLNGSNRKQQLNSEGSNGSIRRQEVNIHSFQRDQYEEDIDYETLGETDQQLNGNQTFTVIEEKKREDLFAKYQVRDIENNELLSASPPPELFNDDDDDDNDDVVDDSFVFKKLPNVGGALLLEETSTVKSSDKFKTYNASKHKREESKKMPPPAADVKKGGVARREAVSPPPKAASKPAARKVEAKVTSPPQGARRPAPAALTKQSSSPQPKTTSYNSTTNMQKATDKRSTPTVATRGSPTSTATPKQSGPARRAPLQSAAAPANNDLVECRVCHRRFASDRIAKHESICDRTSRKKRKEYDATKHRVAGTEAEAYVRRASRSGAQQQLKGPSKKDDWRKKHEDFIATIRAAKQAQAHVKAGGNLRDLPPPPPLDTSDYIQCPHCLRKFNEAAAERHIPRCATMIHNKPKSMPANTTRGAAAVKRR